MNNREFSVGRVFGKKLYDGSFSREKASDLYEEASKFLRTTEVQEELSPILKSEEILLKPNLVDPRPPETGCVNHPTIVKVVLDHLLKSTDFKGVISICEAYSYYRGDFIFKDTFTKLISPEEQAFIKTKIQSKDPCQDRYDFGFDLTLELSGIKSLIKEYPSSRVRILNISKEPFMKPEECKELVNETEQSLGQQLIPQQEIRSRIISHIPSILKNKKIGIISLAVPKTHLATQVQVTGSIKNIAVGLIPQTHKAFIHKDLTKGMIYIYNLWKKGCEGRVFGMVSGPYGMDENGPDWGRPRNFPYFIVGSDLLAVDCVTTALMFGKPDIVNEIEQFVYAQDKIGKIPPISELKKLVPLGLNYKPHPEMYRLIQERYLS